MPINRNPPTSVYEIKLAHLLCMRPAHKAGSIKALAQENQRKIVARDLLSTTPCPPFLPPAEETGHVKGQRHEAHQQNRRYGYTRSR